MLKTKGKRVAESLKDPDQDLKAFSYIVILLVLYALRKASFEEIQKKLYKEVHKGLSSKNIHFAFVYGSSAHDPSGKSPGLDQALLKYIDLGFIECSGEPPMFQLSLKGKGKLFDGLPFIRDFVNKMCVKATDYCELYCPPPDYGSEFIFKFLKSA